MNIKEYGVQQTSLEQIFAGFANQAINDRAAFLFKVLQDELTLVNPDRKSTVQQRRLTNRGLPR